MLGLRKREILLIVISSAIVVLVLFAFASVELGKQPFRMENLTCNSTYKELTVCVYDGDYGGSYEDSIIYVNRLYKDDASIYKHEYCHHQQIAVEGKTVGLLEEVQCYIVGYT